RHLLTAFVHSRTRSALLAAEPSSVRRRLSLARVEYGCQLHDEHELAGLRSRNHDELLHPNGWAGVPQLCICSSRHRPCCRAHSWHISSQFANHRELLGGHNPRDALGLASSLFCSGTCPGFAGCHPEFSSLSTRLSSGCPRSLGTSHSARSGRFT